MKLKGRIPSLDGLRAISILVVSASHLNHLFPNSHILQHVNTWGGHGVDVFFVISGFLITHLLLREKQTTGTVSLSKFYLRRAQRILPAFAFFVLAVVSLGAIGVLTIDRSALPYVLTYTYNLVPHHTLASFGPMWSLCVEEHFYLVWPLIVFLCSRRLLLAVLSWAMLLAIPIRVYLETHRSVLNPDFFTLTRWDTIAAGCALAVLYPRIRLWLMRSSVATISAAAYFALIPSS